jgi:hypothetical protein
MYLPRRRSGIANEDPHATSIPLQRSIRYESACAEFFKTERTASAYIPQILGISATERTPALWLSAIKAIDASS